MIRNHMNRIVNRIVECDEVSVKWHDDEERLKQLAWNQAGIRVGYNWASKIFDANATFLR